MFSPTKYMEQDSTKNHLTLAKTNRVSKCTLSVQYKRQLISQQIELL